MTRGFATRGVLSQTPGLFGVFGSGVSPAEREARRVDDYLDSVREVERRFQAVGAFGSSGEARAHPEAPKGRRWPFGPM